MLKVVAPHAPVLLSAGSSVPAPPQTPSRGRARLREHAHRRAHAGAACGLDLRYAPHAQVLPRYRRHPTCTENVRAPLLVDAPSLMCPDAPDGHVVYTAGARAAVRW
ncbi:hypothetical protein C8J57DRAFT_1490016 [Mycena rebaudengoi]|nr:hypothetical protein C8J57DRAFT_1490016 [Mycena rebaudengoi]